MGVVLEVVGEEREEDDPGHVERDRERELRVGGALPGLGSKRVIQRRFNMSVPRARVPEKASTLRDRSER